MQVEKVLKALFVRKLYLWPRFEAQVKQVLEQSDADIEVVPCRAHSAIFLVHLRKMQQSCAFPVPSSAIVPCPLASAFSSCPALPPHHPPHSCSASPAPLLCHLGASTMVF